MYILCLAIFLFIDEDGYSGAACIPRFDTRTNILMGTSDVPAVAMASAGLSSEAARPTERIL